MQLEGRRLKTLPWLDHTGQTTAELLAAKETHRIDSLLCAFEWGIQAKPDTQINEEERLVLAVMALEREVHDGGYSQFFENSSREFVPIIIASLRRIGCDAAATITQRAITARKGRSAILDACDQDFFKVTDITTNLFRFVEQHQDRIQTGKPARLPETPRSLRDYLYNSINMARRPGTDVAALSQLCRDLAAKESIPATEADIEAAAVLYAFDRAVYSEDLAFSESLAPRALELLHASSYHTALPRKWAGLLLSQSRPEMADQAVLTYLTHLKSCDLSTFSNLNRVFYWAPFLKEHQAELPRSVAFYVANFSALIKKYSRSDRGSSST
jgi:hypothetical protein